MVSGAPGAGETHTTAQALVSTWNWELEHRDTHVCPGTVMLEVVGVTGEV